MRDDRCLMSEIHVQSVLSSIPASMCYRRSVPVSRYGTSYRRLIIYAGILVIQLTAKRYTWPPECFSRGTARVCNAT